MEDQKLVPFGKYKDEPIEILKTDDSYRNWLLNQDWFKAKYPNLFMLVINKFEEPTDTPEHNKLQRLFLKNKFIKEFVYVESNGKSLFRFNNRLERYLEEQKEKIRSLKLLRLSDLETVKRADYIAEISYLKFEPIDVSFQYSFGVEVNLNNNRPIRIGFEKRYNIEIKPSVGDDYPTVLRKMKADKCNCLFLENYSGVGISKSEFKQIFNVSNISVVFLEDVKKQKLPDYDNALDLDINQYLTPDESSPFK